MNVVPRISTSVARRGRFVALNCGNANLPSRTFGSSSRLLSTPSSSNSPEVEEHWEPSNIDPELYHAIADAGMDSMTEYFEALADDGSIELEGFDVEYSQGVLTLRFGDLGTYVMNKQPPNKQIWLSSPTSGPKRYDFDPDRGEWVYYRDGSTLKELLDTELSAILDTDIRVPIETEPR